ncbi:PREDICTED: heavy metal-associated isoprenylated plant [Prunus dulcis]|uniref:PREDICTED: heavy metal-associated isoprenylated plant n=1 Tax=Prunus dulcis TaxID=3755 RepID=A0A5E4G033_PRUDU|nr:heavy metal-associated isoprenylated plant protein 33-like [Prunus dulcis]VVA33024.1 PREDICTED: heavy metal-associated isoprenylated plant [Prunus dulcis]
MESRSYMTCGLKVDTKSGGWHKCLTKMLKKIRGASYNVDAEAGMAYISGKVNPTKLLRRLVQAGKEAEICWVRTGDQCNNYDGYGEGNIIVNANGYYDHHSYYRAGAVDPYMDGYNGPYGQRSSYYPYGHYYPQAPPYTYY